MLRGVCPGRRGLHAVGHLHSPLHSLLHSLLHVVVRHHHGRVVSHLHRVHVVLLHRSHRGLLVHRSLLLLLLLLLLRGRVRVGLWLRGGRHRHLRRYHVVRHALFVFPSQASLSFLLLRARSSVPKLVDGIAFAPAPTPLFSCGALLCCLRPVPRSHALVCLRASLLLRLYPSLSWVGELGSSCLRRAASGQPSKTIKPGGGLGAPVLYRNKVRSRASSRGCPPSRAALWVSLRGPALSFAPLACASGNRDCRGPQNMGFLHAAFLESSRARSPRARVESNLLGASIGGNAFFRKCSFFSCSRSGRWSRS